MEIIEFIREGGFVYLCTVPGDMSGEYIPASYAAEVARLQAQVEAMREALVSLLDACELAETSINLALEKMPGVEKFLKNDVRDISIAIAQAKKIEAARATLARVGGVSPAWDDPALIADFFTGPESTGKEPYEAFGEWAAANGYNVEDEAQLAAAIEAYGGENASL